MRLDPSLALHRPGPAPDEVIARDIGVLESDEPLGWVLALGNAQVLPESHVLDDDPEAVVGAADIVEVVIVSVPAGPQGLLLDLLLEPLAGVFVLDLADLLRDE
jgi:hypothetical protein